MKELWGPMHIVTSCFHFAGTFPTRLDTYPVLLYRVLQCAGCISRQQEYWKNKRESPSALQCQAPYIKLQRRGIKGSFLGTMEVEEMGAFIKSGCLLRNNLAELPLKTSSPPSLLLCSQAESCSVTTGRGETDDVFGCVEFHPHLPQLMENTGLQRVYS